jgi:hypothetical protein
MTLFEYMSQENACYNIACLCKYNLWYKCYSGKGLPCVDVREDYLLEYFLY